jgi:hypothetical protein
LFRPPHVGSLQDTNLGLSKFPIFFREPLYACWTRGRWAR